MSGSKAKELRRICNIDLRNCDPIQKRIYRRLKKRYNKLPENKRSDIKYGN
jgi:hypothetical protein